MEVIVLRNGAIKNKKAGDKVDLPEELAQNLIKSGDVKNPKAKEEPKEELQEEKPKGKGKGK